MADALRTDDAYERERRRALRLEVAGRMARGIARELVDLVTVIRGHASLLIADADRETNPSAGAIERATTQAAELARRLLVLGGDGLLTPRRTRLDQLVADLSQTLASTAHPATLDLRLDPTTPEVHVDAEQLGRALIDLLASNQPRVGADGHVTISVRPGPEGSGRRRRALLEVRDDGRPLTPDLAERWFEPYTDEATGLPRAEFYGIVEQSGGVASLASAPGATVFVAAFPALVEADEEAPVEPDPGPASGSILIVEDQDDVRSFMARALMRAGYEVTDTASAEDALGTSSEYWGPPIDLLIADVVLPGMTGPELARTLQASRPDLPVLYISGQASDLTAFHGLAGLAGHVLAKPFDVDVLLRRVRSILETRTAGVEGRLTS